MALLPPMRRQLLASQVAANIRINLFVFDQVCLVSAINALLSNSGSPVGCRRASRVQAGRPGAGRNKALAHDMYSDELVPVYTCMYPLNQDKNQLYKYVQACTQKI
jgi:hypothetical protein